MESYDLSIETRFIDSILDIMHVCSIKNDVEQAKKDFNELESMIVNDEFKNEIKKAESMFDLVMKNPTINEYVCGLKEALSKIYNIGRTSLTSRNYAQ